MVETRECGLCGNHWEWQKRTGRKPKYCPTCKGNSHADLMRNQRAKYRETNPRTAEWPRTCRYCTHEFTARSPRAEVCYELGCQRRKNADRTNKFYQTFKLKHGKTYPYVKYPEKRRAYRDWRNVRVRGATTGEPVDRREIFERDNWTCGLCYLSIDPELKFPHPMSASLDHVVPVSHGGPHTRSNVQASHLTCNTSRQDNPIKGYPKAA